MKESDDLTPESPYGRSKMAVEFALKDACQRYSSNGELVCGVLRYFNPGGAHSSGLLGEQVEKPGNLVPILTRLTSTTLLQRETKEVFKVFGSDWETKDGSCVRDFIHITDLASSHLKGVGVSVLEVVEMMRRVSGVEVKVELERRREGDVGWAVGCTERSKGVLGFVAEKGLEEICRDAWKFELHRLGVERFISKKEAEKSVDGVLPTSLKEERGEKISHVSYLVGKSGLLWHAGGTAVAL
ncbi:UDP-glucose-4-epimerase [Chytridiales sp. JEL 0842]|nr:UDP-glucose-4-epimerase [Chytridiales sp. JEL 0842]